MGSGESESGSSESEGVGSVLLSPQLSLPRCRLTNELVSLRTKTLVSSSEREREARSVPSWDLVET